MNEKTETPAVNAARILATAAHKGQVDQAGAPYIGHPAAVAAYVAHSHPGDMDAVTVAWLHDVVEDTATPLSLIEEKFGPKIAAAVDAITHRPGEKRDDYYRRVAVNETALLVKRADIRHNSDPVRLGALDPATSRRLKGKYRHATEMLDLLTSR